MQLHFKSTVLRLNGVERVMMSLRENCVRRVVGGERARVNMKSYLESADDLLHLCPAEIQEAFDQVPVYESCGLLRFTLCVEGPPGITQSKKNPFWCFCLGRIPLGTSILTFLRQSEQI